jgi:zinc protease
MQWRLGIIIGAALTVIFATASPAAAEETNVARATLANGLHVVVIHDPLAPVVTTILNYQAGSDEQWIPGLAHATEHMMFRGSATLSSAQLMQAIGITGGDLDADTTNGVTQFYFTVPSAYLDVALRAERSRATGLLMTQALWQQERGAITQEVQQDNSDAFYRLFTKMQERLIGGTPYAKNTLGTVNDFAHNVDGTQIRRFYGRWYHPNNAVYIIAGDVDPQTTIARVRTLFGDLGRSVLPAREPVHLGPLHAALYRDTSDQGYTEVALGYRFPGYESPDYAAGQILGDVLNNSRSTFGGLPYTGRALATEFFSQEYSKAGVALAFAAIPVAEPPEKIDAEMRSIIDGYRKGGVPADIVAASKLREIAQLEFSGNSIEGLAFEWSQAVAVQRLTSPNDMIAQFNRVTVADVNRVLRRYLDNDRAVVAYAVPKNTGAASSGGGLVKENNEVPPTTHEPLPSWAAHILDHLQVPPQTIAPVDMRLSNGMRLIVQPEHITHTVVVAGKIENNAHLEEPAGQEGVADITDGLLPFGTTTYDRIALQTQLDEIAATTSPGTDFSLDVLSSHFSRGVELLADEELHPAFNAADFSVVRDQTVGELSGEMSSPDHLAEVALNKALYPAGDPTQRFATPTSVGSLTVADVRAWYDKVYRPDMTTVVVIGDTTPDEARAVFESSFGRWQSSGPKPATELPAVPLNTAAQVEIPATGRVQSSVQLVETLSLTRANDDWAPLQVADAALTGGFFSSLLYHDLREVHGYVYSVESSLAAGKTRAVFSLSYGCDPGNIVPAQSQIAAILSQLQRTPIDAGRLLRSKALLVGGLPIRAASYDGVTEQLLGYASLGLPLDQSVLDARAELAASAQSVQAALVKYVRPSGFVRVVTGPGPQ